MGRTARFERDAVVAAAMEVFWSAGYQGASLQRLRASTGLGPGSLYAAFGNKEGLFLAALERYANEIAGLAAREKDPRRLLEGWFAQHIERAQPGQRGCLLLNASAELPALDRAAAAAVRAELGRLEQFFDHTVAKLRGGASNEETLAQARLLIAALAGISSLSRAGIPRETLEDVARTALASLAPAP